MLTADTHLHTRSYTTSEAYSSLDELTDTIEIDSLERIIRIELLVRIVYVV